LTPLSVIDSDHSAALSGRVDCMRVLIEKGAAVDPANHNYITPIMYALIRRHYEAVKLLLRHGAIVASSSKKNFGSPLLQACKICDYDTLQMILAQPNIQHHLEDEDKVSTHTYQFISSTPSDYYLGIHSIVGCYSRRKHRLYQSISSSWC